MLFLLSPAKSLDLDTPVPAEVQALASEPLFPQASDELIDVLRGLRPEQLSALMGISADLAILNAGRYRDWAPADPARSRPAAWSFDGDVYGGLAARELSVDDLRWAQQHLIILSGLYGMLRPLDRLQPYRLEMGTRLPVARAADLYGYWSDRLARALNERAADDVSPVIVNLASQEYFKSVDRPGVLKPRVVDCVFEDWNDGRFRIVGFYAKRARGLMARHAVRERIGTPLGLAGFESEGYRFEAGASSPERMVFRRREADRAAADRTVHSQPGRRRSAGAAKSSA